MPQASEVAVEEGRWEPDSGFRILVDWIFGTTERGEPKMTPGIFVLRK